MAARWPSRVQEYVWPGGLARTAAASEGVGAVVDCVIGSGVIIASIVASRMAAFDFNMGSGPPPTAEDIIRGYMMFLCGGCVLVGIPLGLPVGAMLWAIDRNGPRYWRPVSRARWRLALLSPMTAVIPAIVLGMLAAIASSGGVSEGVRLAALAGLPVGYVALFVWGVIRAWRRAPALIVDRQKCTHCGYPRAGLLRRAPCPECGQVPRGMLAPGA